MADSRKNKIKKWQYTNAADQIERLQARVEELEGLRDAVVYSVEAGFKPPRILQEALAATEQDDMADEYLDAETEHMKGRETIDEAPAATEQEVSDEPL